MRLSVVFFLFLFLITGFLQISAQMQMGIEWHVPTSTQSFEEELAIIEAAGFKGVLLIGSVQPQVFDRIRATELEIISNPGLNYLHRSYFPENEAYFKRIITRYANGFASADGIVVTAFSAFYNDSFVTQLKQVVEQFRINEQDFNPVIITQYPLSSNQWPGYRQLLEVNQHSEQITDSSLSDFLFVLNLQHTDVRSVQHQLVRAKSITDDKMVWFSHDNLVQILTENDRLVELFHVYANQSEPVYPNNPAIAKDDPWNFYVLLFWLLIGSFLVLFRFEPVYGKAIWRYFTSHPFFIVDIFERHLRLGRIAFILTILLSLSFALAGMLTIIDVFDGKGLEIISHHNRFFLQESGVFIFWFIFIATIVFFSIIWISAVSFRNDVFSQVSALYVCPLHSFIPLMVLIVLNYSANLNPVFSLILFAVMLTILFTSFFIVSADFSTNPTLSKGMHLLLTIVLYLIIIVALGFVIMTYTHLFDIMELAYYHSR